MTFDKPLALWMIFLLPILLLGIGYLGWARGQEPIELFLLDRVKALKNLREKYLAAGLLLTGLLVGFASPKIPLPSLELLPRTGEVLFLVDVSGSMSARADLEQPSRLERVKAILLPLVDRLEGLGQVRLSLHGFTGIARSHVPFIGPEDYPYLRESIKNVLDIYSTPGHGTSFGQAILNVAGKFSNGANAKLIVLFSDGEVFIGTEPGMHEVERSRLEEAIAQANKAGIQIITVGVGEREGALIPINNSKGNPTGDYVRLNGAEYRSYLHEDVLIELANRTGGEYIREEDLEELYARVEGSLSSASSESTAEETYEPYPIAHWFILIGVPLWAVLIRRYLVR